MEELQVLLVHPGGPFYAKKDLASWSIPKGELDDSESALTAAIRELQEETGIEVREGFIELDPVKQSSGKEVYAWAVEKDVDTSSIVSNSFEMEWPPKSGRVQAFPQIDKAEWFNISDTSKKLIAGQVPLLTQLEDILKL